jgi:hypothetical protein
MHHCFAAAVQLENDFDFQIVPGVICHIMLVCNRLRDFSEK